MSDTDRIRGFEFRGALANCGAQAITVITSVRGTSCDDYEAEIRGVSEGCVSTCDGAARLREAIASARATCAAFCAARNCPPGLYDPPRQCAALSCFASSLCPGGCPMYEQCALEQQTRRFNCKCIVF